MASIEKIIFGYREVKIDIGDSDYFANILLKAGISATIRDGIIDIPLSKYKRFSKFASKKQFTASEPRGLFALLIALKKRLVLLISLTISALIILLMCNVVWDVRIDETEGVEQAYILNTLSECGLDTGKLFSHLDFSEIENKCLILCDDISWININRKGMVAYVKVIKNSTQTLPIEDSLYSNVVASCDGVIEEIDVISGKALVKVGDVVRQGDILISGIIGTDENIEFCHARGTVRASVNATITTFAPKEEERTVYKEEKLISKAIKIFNFKINIFKNYGNSEGECDIIDDVKVCELPGGVRLPIKIYTERARFKEQYVYRYTESELTECASYILTRQLDNMIGDGVLTSIKSSGNFNNDGYLLTTEIVYVRDIGKSVPFSQYKN